VAIHAVEIMDLDDIGMTKLATTRACAESDPEDRDLLRIER
jgi:hypothetical protein